ncbi:S1 family peptidase [Microvirga subterranea]|uniref:Trypsin-like peptidase n=1 Tax=Microvirga subterranea TaxID=186651 RepID=A0A370H9Z4_9HYPH|nr:serine protease [Microvirga subterranea]RDI53626.1 trypsin-like peptidase [Microvirga subterranea]
MAHGIEPSDGETSSEKRQHDLSISNLSDKLKALEEKVSQPKPKDKWDKFAALSTLISGLTVAFIGFYATNIYDSRSKELDQSQKQRSTIASELQVVEKFIPHLASTDVKIRSAALAALSAIGNTELAGKLSRVFGDAEAQAAVTAVSKPEPHVSVPLPKSNNPLDFIERYKASIAFVDVSVDGNTLKQGSAFPINKDGFLITAAHLIELNASVSVRFGSRDALPYSAQVVSRSEASDIALLRVSSVATQVAVPTLAPSSERLNAGSKLFVMAFALSMPEPMLIEGVATGSPGPDLTQAISSPLVPGMSGGPVFNSEGQVVGIVKGGAVNFPSLSFIVPAQFVRGLLATAGL